MTFEFWQNLSQFIKILMGIVGLGILIFMSWILNEIRKNTSKND
jgi:predicted HAD superfamily hydrolase